MKRNIRLPDAHPALFLLILLLFTVASPIAHAQNKILYWQRYDVDLTVQQNGDLRVVETQELVFTSGTFRFGQREILHSRFSDLKDVTVGELDGPEYAYAETDAPYTYRVFEDGGYFKIRYNFPSSADMRRTIVIGYTVTEALRYYPENGVDQLSWKAVPAGNPFPTQSSTITLHLPEPATFTNYTLYGADSDAGFQPDQRDVAIHVAGRIDVGQEVAAVAEWQHGIVAGQPAPWQAEVDRAAEAERRQVQNIVIQPPLAFGGHIYTVMYQAAGQYRRSDANLFFDTAADTLTRKNILGLTVWRDDVLVTDEEELRTVFTLYTAAYLLYERPPGSSLGSTPPDIRDDLQKITRNPLLPEQQTKELFKSRQDRIQDAMRGILTPQVPPAEVEQLASDIRRNVEQGKTVIDAFDKTVETMRFSNNHSIRQLRVAIREAFKDWQPVIEQGTSYVDIGAGRRLELFNALDVIDVGTRLLWMADFNQERANWLKGYQQATIDQEEARLDDEQMVAVDIVRSEVQSSSAQRANIILDFVRDKTVDLTWKLGIEELTRRWVAWSWQTFGKRIVGHLVAGAATTVELALRLGDLLYGLDDLYDNFQVAVQADELRVRFQAGRLALQRQARDEDKMIYNGELAEAFRYAYLLEMLAGAQTQRGYADGVAATVRQENWLAQLNPLNWIKGAEWREATEGLHKLANQDEQKAEADLGHPASVDAAVVLALQTAHTEVPHSVPTRIPTPTATPPPYAKLEPTVAALHATVQALQTQVAVLSNALAQAPAQRDGTPVPGHAATLIGKWELQHGGGDCLGMFEPTSIEFFDDGTYVATVSSMWILSPQMGGHYMLLEEKRVRFEVPQMGFEICELNLSGDVFTLAGSAGKVNRYVRYREASTTTYRQAITGQWERAGYSENECFEPFGGNPNELIMMPDEMFVARGTNKNWYGQYFVVGSSVQFAQSMAQPKVTWTPAPSAKFSEMQMLFDVLAILSGSGMSSSDSPPEPFEGTTTCEIRRITEMQLILVDSKGNQTVFRRSKTEEELLQTLKDTATDQIVPTPSR